MISSSVITNSKKYQMATCIKVGASLYYCALMKVVGSAGSNSGTWTWIVMSTTVRPNSMTADVEIDNVGAFGGGDV